MNDATSLNQNESGDTLPGPGAKSRVHGDLKGREMESIYDGGARRAVIYIRVASAEHAAQQQAARQEEACREVAQRLGFKVVEVYGDIGAKDRPMLRRMLNELDSIKPKVVISLDASRFGRRYQENTAVTAQLTAAGVEAMFVHSPTHAPPWAAVLVRSQPASVKEVVR